MTKTRIGFCAVKTTSSLFVWFEQIWRKNLQHINLLAFFTYTEKETRQTILQWSRISCLFLGNMQVTDSEAVICSESFYSYPSSTFRVELCLLTFAVNVRMFVLFPHWKIWIRSMRSVGKYYKFLNGTHPFQLWYIFTEVYLPASHIRRELVMNNIHTEFTRLFLLFRYDSVIRIL